MMMMIPRVVFFFLAAAFVAVLGQDSEHTCLADGSHCSCRDEHESCKYWQSLGEW
jgi:hypothetical protein